MHSGYGRYGKDMVMIDAASHRSRVNESMRKFFGAQIQLSNAGKSAYHVDGTQQDMYSRLLPGAEVHFATQEFGTVHPLRMLAALRAENRWHHYGIGEWEHASKRRLRAVFSPVDQRWRENVLRRGREVIHQALGLAFPPPPYSAPADGNPS